MFWTGPKCAGISQGIADTCGLGKPLDVTATRPDGRESQLQGAVPEMIPAMRLITSKAGGIACTLSCGIDRKR